MLLDSVLPRRVSQLLMDLVTVEPVIALHGPRSVGKSTVLRGFAAESGSSVLDLDDVGVREAVIGNLASVVRAFEKAAADNEIEAVIKVVTAAADLRLADRLPLRVSCQCRAHWDDPALDQLCFEREVDLGTCGDLAAAMIMARTVVTSGLIAAGSDPALRLAPQFITILDAKHCLVLAGDVKAGIQWCAPVDSDAEARRVVTDACGLRAAARAATDVGDPASAAALLTRARSLEGRLVDPFWRDLAAAAFDHGLAA